MKMSFVKVKKSVLQQAFDECLLRKPRSVWSKALQWAPESHGIRTLRMGDPATAEGALHPSPSTIRGGR